MRTDKIIDKIHLYLAYLDTKFPFRVPTRPHHIKPFALKSTLLEAVKGLNESEAYSKLKLQEALNKAKALGEETDRIEEILNEFKMPLEEGIIYTFEELRQKLEKTNPQKFSILIKQLQNLPEKHQLIFSVLVFENIERAHYSKLFKDVKALCESLYGEAKKEEKEILDMVVKRIEECLNYINPEKPKKPAVLI